jgi:hypothetical protein
VMPRLDQPALNGDRKLAGRGVDEIRCHPFNVALQIIRSELRQQTLKIGTRLNKINDLPYFDVSDAKAKHARRASHSETFCSTEHQGAHRETHLTRK